MAAIIAVETGGDCDAKGKSGEHGCMQFLPSTWRLWATEVYGEFREQNPQRERYVAYKKIEKWLAEGHGAYEIALIWNGGTPTEKRGVNKHGVPFDTRQYALNVLDKLN